MSFHSGLSDESYVDLGAKRKDKGKRSKFKWMTNTSSSMCIYCFCWEIVSNVMCHYLTFTIIPGGEEMSYF